MNLLFSILFFLVLNLTIIAQSNSYFQAVEEYKIGNYQRSSEILNKLNEEGKGSFETFALLGYSLDKMNEMEASISAISEARKRNPVNEKLAEDLLALYTKNKKGKLSIELAEKFVSMFPNNGAIRYLYAVNLQQKGAGKLALTQIEKAKAFSSVDARTLELEGKIYYQLRYFDKAEMSLKWATSIEPNTASLWNNLGLVQESLYKQFAKLGKKTEADSYLNEAKQSLEKAMELDTNSELIKENSKRIRSLNP